MNVNKKTSGSTKKVFICLFLLVGYKNVAIEQTYVHNDKKGSKEPKEDKKADPVPLPVDLSAISKVIKLGLE